MILVEMFRGTMTLPTRISAKFFAPKGGGGDTDERKLQISAAADPREVHRIFFSQSTYFDGYDF